MYRTYRNVELRHDIRSHIVVRTNGIDFDEDRVIVRNEDYLSTTLDGEAVLLDSDTGTYYGMNQVGTLLWEELESPRSVKELRAVLSDEFDVDESTAAADVDAFLSDLFDAGLVSTRSQADAG